MTIMEHFRLAISTSLSDLDESKVISQLTNQNNLKMHLLIAISICYPLVYKTVKF